MAQQRRPAFPPNYTPPQHQVVYVRQDPKMQSEGCVMALLAFVIPPVGLLFAFVFLCGGKGTACAETLVASFLGGLLWFGLLGGCTYVTVMMAGVPAG